MAGPIVAIDVETTGFGPYDRIVSLAAIRCHASGKVDGIYLCFDPKRNSHPRAAMVHGWDDWTTRFQDLFADHAPSVRAFVDSSDLIVAHNASFDIDFLNRELIDSGHSAVEMPTFCTMKQARHEWPRGPAKLDLCARRIGLRRQSAIHHPMEDAFFSLCLYRHFGGLPALFPPDEGWGLPSNFRRPPPMPDGGLPRRKAKKPNPNGMFLTEEQVADVVGRGRPLAIVLNFVKASEGKVLTPTSSTMTLLIDTASKHLGVNLSVLDMAKIGERLSNATTSIKLCEAAVRKILSNQVWREYLPLLLKTVVAEDGKISPQENDALNTIRDIIVRTSMHPR